LRLVIIERDGCAAGFDKVSVANRVQAAVYAKELGVT
jgi:hypothetical protein